MNKRHSIVLYLFLFLSILTISCKKGKKSFVEIKDVITGYHQKYFNQQIEPSTSENFAIYLDYSGSIKTAFDDKPTENFYNLFINSLKISTVDFYEVASDQVVQIQNLDKSELYKKIKDASKFNKINAPLDLALNQIIDKKKEAVLITDGELWMQSQPKDPFAERDDPWAREGFSRWLKDGNSIIFYVTDHIDAKKEKHLFYMFFIPKNKMNDQNNIANQFKYYLDNSVEAKSLKYSSFTFNNQGYEITQEYATETSGGVNQNAELDQQTYINKGKTLGFEYQEYILTWDDLVKFIRSATDVNGNPLPGGEPLISKLFLHIDKLEFYSINELDIKVSDVKKDIDKLIFCQECQTSKPEFELNEKGEKTLDEENHPIVKIPGDERCYNEFGELTADTVFKAGESLPEVKELFTFDQQAFMNNFKEQKRGEIIIKIHPNFNGTQISSDDENLHRIDVFLKDVTVKADNPNLNKFIWQGKQVESNRSIYNSILGALNEANPKGKVIYSFYIKTQPNDYKP
jgi:hypothetical protein